MVTIKSDGFLDRQQIDSLLSSMVRLEQMLTLLLPEEFKRLNKDVVMCGL
jgi:hypothetical protein